MNRFKQIDILRALAVFLVLGRHLTPCPPERSAFLHQVTEIWARGGWIGVDLFFVLSGFLVSGLLFREYEKYRELRVGHFLIRRGFKIYPPFWLLIGFTIVSLVLRHQAISWPAVAAELLFVQNYGPSLWHHTWSLAVEEHFYFLLAIGIFVMVKRRSERPFAPMPAVFAVVALLCLALRIYVSLHSPFKLNTHVFPSHLRIDGLCFGVLLSYWYHRQPLDFLSAAHRFRYGLAGIGIGLLVPAFCFPLDSTPFIYTYGFTLFYLGSGCLLVAAMGFQNTANSLARAIAYVGSHSYSVYLWHMVVAGLGTAIVERLLSQHDNWCVYAAAYLAGSIAFGVGMAIFTEFPVLRLRDRLFPSRGAALSTNETAPATNTA